MRKVKQRMLVLFALVFALAAGGLLGWGAAFNSIKPKPLFLGDRFIGGNVSADVSADTKASLLRLRMNDLLKEHTVLAAMFLTGHYEGKDTTRLRELNNENAQEIAQEFQEVYGNETDERFLALWDRHMSEYVNFTDAVKNNSQEQQNIFRENLEDISGEFAQFISEIRNSESEQLVAEHMDMHTKGTVDLVTAHAKGDETAKANLAKTGYDQAGMFADILVRGMIEDKPEMFQ